MDALSELRTSYTRAVLEETGMEKDPIQQLHQWLEEAVTAGVRDPNAMTLATVSNNRPSARIVLLKGMDERGLTFFTDYGSRKAHDLEQHPFASMVFYWANMERQVRVEGAITKTDEEESDAYFYSRPLNSRIGAWVSRQSTVLDSRSVLDTREVECIAQFGTTPTRPPYWGGYRLCPDTFEFWQGRPSRLHDRFQYTRQDGMEWKIARLSP